MSRRQMTLFKKERQEHGGHVRARQRKEARPFSPKCAIHVVMRSEKARGPWSLLHRRNRSNVEKLVYRWANAQQIRVYRFENVGNHIHLLLRAPSRPALQRFLKTFAGLCARAITGAQKGRSITGEGQRRRFWDATAYSRLVPGGAYRALTAYLKKNRLEAVGFQGVTLKRRGGGLEIAFEAPPPGCETWAEALEFPGAVPARAIA